MVLNNGEDTVAVANEEERWQTQIKSMKEGIRHIYKTGEFSDTTYVINGKKFKVHKLVLAARSPVFEDTFYQQNASGEIIDECSEKGFEILLRYIYTDELGTTDEAEILEAFRVAMKFQQQELIEECESLIQNWDIGLDKVYDILNDSLDIEYLKNRCFSLIRQNSEAALSSPNFIRVQPIVLEELLSQKCFDDVPAKKLCDNVLKWGSSQFTGLKDFKPLRDFLMGNNILGKLKLHKLSTDDLIGIRRHYRNLLTPEEILDLQDYASQPGPNAYLPDWCEQ